MKKVISIFTILFISLVWTAVDVRSNTNERVDMGLCVTPSFYHHKDICPKIKKNSKDPVYLETEENYCVLDESLRDNDKENDGKRMMIRLCGLASNYPYLNKIEKETSPDYYSSLFISRNTNQQRK